MLFDEVLAAGPVRELVSDSAWLRAMLDAEAALAAAQADAGVLDRTVADEIASACAPALFDLAALARDAAATGNPAAPLARALTARVPAEAARYVHFGATSQDILDTAAMLVSRQAIAALLTDLLTCCDDLASLADGHRHTVCVGRTLLQQALPVTFGLTAAGWLSGLGSAGEVLAEVRPAAQLGGAVGTLAALGSAGPAVLPAYARRLGLAEPDLPWHTDRGRVADLAAALARVCAAVSKIAGDVVLLAQTEVGELTESAETGATERASRTVPDSAQSRERPSDTGAGATERSLSGLTSARRRASAEHGRREDSDSAQSRERPSNTGGSSAMPHKRNPVAAVSARAAAAQAPGLVSTLLANAAHEHQRAAGAWHAEWRPLTELLRCTGSAVWWLRTSVSGLTVHPDRMRENLARTGGALLAERVTVELAPRIGRLAAHDAVAECVQAGGDLARRLAEHPELGLDREQAARLLEPAGYLGAAGEFVDRALAAHQRRKGRAWTSSMR